MAMLKLFFLFMHVVSLLCLQSGSSFVAGFMQGGNETDRLALLAFKAAITSDPFGALNSWNESIHFCQWVGVKCGRQHQRVTGLRNDHKKLSGSVSPHIGNLSFLRNLWLRNNSLSGEIPQNSATCEDYKEYHWLTGNIPTEIGSLSKLEGLYIAKNNLVGSLPSILGNLSSLTIIFATNNKIGNNVPDTLGGWKKLKALQLGLNNLVGTIPFSIYNLSSIEIFEVSENQIEGSLPSDLGITLPNLQVLTIASNLFTGSIPITISNATKLAYLFLGRNKFIEKVPSLENVPDLTSIVLEVNLLGTGEVDDLSFLDTLTNATRLSVMGLATNNFGGVLPESISNFSTKF
ncbi:probable LRR receptor-like serine/threonine-protein kinase At3g47570 [Rhododendron vialii]|uniref:probable LRR receptor-like serine/threonine-protein kinase At3g47570 n=1 Tax=Rhododendron vialii TaxID=182163 RepID=UPI00265DB76F|nr:probable LRR receptor-like serine/threonine-protein kinase At3g47570 [Rhododendron vialii]